MPSNCTWTALRNPAFRKLWIAAVISGTCMLAHENAATWMMNILAGSPLLLSLMSTVASVAFFLFTLPAGALADRVNRQKLVCTINVLHGRHSLCFGCAWLDASSLLVLVYALMALVRQTEAFFIVAALGGAGWTMSASELWIAAQRMMPDWARGRLNAAVIVISQGAMVLGGAIWGSASAIAGVSYALLGAAVLFLASLLLARQLPVGAMDLSSLNQTFDAHNEGRRLEKLTSESMTVFNTQ